MVPSNHSIFSIAPCKVFTLNPFCILFIISSLLLFDGSHSKVIDLPTIGIAIVIALKGYRNIGKNTIFKGQQKIFRILMVAIIFSPTVYYMYLNKDNFL